MDIFYAKLHLLKMFQYKRIIIEDISKDKSFFFFLKCRSEDNFGCLFFQIFIWRRETYSWKML